MALLITILTGAAVAPSVIDAGGWAVAPAAARADARVGVPFIPPGQLRRDGGARWLSRIAEQARAAADAAANASAPETTEPVAPPETEAAAQPPADDAAAAAPAAPAAGGAGEGSAGGMFPLLAPGSALPSGEECAARVQRSAWEPRPENAEANSTRPDASASYGMSSWFNSVADGAGYRGRVDGNFTGTTDEIIQWASCKWGFPTDLNRAQAVIETTWDQSFVGDGGESHGLYQMRANVWGGLPNSSASTAFNADWAMGLRRACYDGVMWYSELRGNLDACIGVHYSGDPDESSWRPYTDAVRECEQDKPWLGWSSAAGVPPTTSRQG
ncbi:MAG TPA: hypothetical protein VK402_22615 [Blastococcus sp.]|nr:hypothetical protein [Blastococcus sp.]